MEGRGAGGDTTWPSAGAGRGGWSAAAGCVVRSLVCRECATAGAKVAVVSSTRVEAAMDGGVSEMTDPSVKRSSSKK